MPDERERGGGDAVPVDPPVRSLVPRGDGTVERSVPAGKVIHAILDNYAAHKHPQVLAWLAEHPRWTFHFTPTSCSWLNAVEGFFSKLTRQSLKRGVFRSVDDLESAITRYIAATNRNPKPFVWTATAKTIQAKLTLNHPSEVSALAPAAGRQCFESANAVFHPVMVRNQHMPA